MGHFFYFSDLPKKNFNFSLEKKIPQNNINISLVKHLLHLSIFNHTKNNLLLYNFFLYSFIDGRLPKPKYEHVYEVDVQNFEPELITNTFKMIGPYRMVVTTDAIKFFAGTKKNLLVVYHFHVKKCFF